MLVSENSFSPSDLMLYAEMLLKEPFRETDNYSWLKSRHIQPEVIKFKAELDKLRPMAQRMSSESCAKIAVKLDTLTDGVHSTAAILATFKKLLLEQHSIQLLEYNVRNAKEKRNRRNRVQPELMPEGRLPTVSFLL